MLKSLISGKHLIFEAGTGVGKSLAYLIPSLIFSVFTKRKCIVATNTINLQEQLLSKDIPTIRELFNRSGESCWIRNFNCALLVGRANYLCTNRLQRALLSKGIYLRPPSIRNCRELQTGWLQVQLKESGKN